MTKLGWIVFLIWTKTKPIRDMASNLQDPEIQMTCVWWHLWTTVDSDIDTRLPSEQQLRWLRTRKLLTYRESTCTNLSVSCPYEKIVYTVFKHTSNTTRMQTNSWQYSQLIYSPLGKRILSSINPILPKIYARCVSKLHLRGWSKRRQTWQTWFHLEPLNLQSSHRLLMMTTKR